MGKRLHLGQEGLRIFVLTLLLVSLGTSHSYGIPEEKGDSASGSEEEREGSPQEEKEGPTAAELRPSFNNLRYDEDWSRLQELSTRQGYDSLKFIPFSKSGDLFLSIGGQLRLRSESWWNFGFGDSSDSYGLSRLRLHADLHLGPRFRVFVEGKSSLSTSRDLPGGLRGLDVDTIDFQNAFLDLNLALEPATVIFRPGRQELQFGAQRLVSPLDWANTRRTFEGARGIVKAQGWRFDGFWSRFVEVRKYSLNCGSSSGRELYGVYGSGNLPAAGGGALDFYWLGYLNEGAQFGNIAGRESRQTVGARAKATIGDSGADFEMEAAYQFGDLEGAGISAFMFTGQIGYTFASAKTSPRVYTNLDLATGDDDPDDNSVQTFNQLFPLGHAYLGYIDLIGRQNVIDWSGGLAFSPAPRWRGTAVAHYFWRENNKDAVYNPGGAVVRAGDAGSSKAIGLELDLTLAYALNRFVNINGGYSHFFPGSFIDESGSSDAIDFLFVTLQLTF